MAAPSGTVWGSIVSSDTGRKGRLGIYTNVTTSGNQATANVQVWFWTIYSCSDTNNVFYYDVGTNISAASTNLGSVSINHTVASGDGWSTSNQTKILDKTYTYTGGASAKVYKVYAILAAVDILNAPVYANTSYTIPALNTYKVTYNANGGSGAPASQTKTHGTTLTLSSTKPTRTGYTFQGWATSSSGSVVYDPGDKYTANASVTLYAVWKAITYTVSYNANGGSGAPASQTKTYGTALTLSSTKPTRTNYTFLGWGTSASATTVAYAPGASYRVNANATLYAIWSSSYTKPRITNLSATRCNSDGSLNPSGTYALVKFSWACDKTVTSVFVDWCRSSDATWTGSSCAVSGTSGSISQVFGNGTLSTDYTYNVRVAIADESGSTTVTTILEGIKFPLDILANGSGIAFGKQADLSDCMDVGYTSRFRSKVCLENDIAIHGKSTSGTDLQVINVNPDNITVVGLGGYVYGVGATSICGDTIYMQTNKGVYAGNCKLATNKILWSGANYMHDGQTASLSEAITSQANGIVLVWSYYSGGASNSEFNTTFIPKQFVTSHAGKGLSSLMTSSGGDTVATKYLYISDTILTGYSGNDAAAHTANSGIYVSPASFVLRYVIGV